MQLSVNKSTLLALADLRGYNIIITSSTVSHSKQAVFRGKHSVNDSKPYLYGKEWDDADIKMDLVEKLLAWARLRPTITLEDY